MKTTGIKFVLFMVSPFSYSYPDKYIHPFPDVLQQIPFQKNLSYYFLLKLGIFLFKFYIAVYFANIGYEGC